MSFDSHLSPPPPSLPVRSRERRKKLKFRFCLERGGETCFLFFFLVFLVFLVFSAAYFVPHFSKEELFKFLP